MCGILGQVSENPINCELFQNNLLKLQHRGPDDFGIYTDSNIALGHTRLTILDVTNNGHQPMISQCQKYIIVYNGEIYNFSDIKEDLEDKNYKFNSNSDTEIILNGYIEYKELIVNKLNGMFAFAIYDKEKKRIFLARDRSGIKPLYYYQDEKTFSFSSELKTLNNFSSVINFDGEVLFLLLGYIPEPMTIYENIFSFPPGFYGYYSNKKLVATAFDEYKFGPKIAEDYNEITEDINDLLYKSVKRNLISDVPIGIFLSGGLDSSVIAIAASMCSSNIQSLSIVFNEKELSEEYYQDLIVRKYDISHTKYLVNEILFLENIDGFFEAMEQPTIDGLNTYFISKVARDFGLKSVLSGVGGDEIFYGYPSYSNSRTLKFLSRIPYSLIKPIQTKNKYKKLELLTLENDLSYYLPTRGIFSPSEISRIMKINTNYIFNLINKLWEAYNSKYISSIDDKISSFELNMYMKNQLLRDTDVFSMTHSLEIRVPFLDKDLVDYVLRIKPKMKFHKRINKVILADAFRMQLPEEIIYRKKCGFTLPFKYWIMNNIKKFDPNSCLSYMLINNKVHWSKFWALYVLKKRFNFNIKQ